MCFCITMLSVKSLDRSRELIYVRSGKRKGQLQALYNIRPSLPVRSLIHQVVNLLVRRSVNAISARMSVLKSPMVTWGRRTPPRHTSSASHIRPSPQKS